MFQKFLALLVISLSVSFPALAIDETTLPPVAPPTLIDDVMGPGGVAVEPPPADDLEKPGVPGITSPILPETAADIIAPILGEPPKTSETSRSDTTEPPPPPVVQKKSLPPKKARAKTKPKKKNQFIYPTSATTRVAPTSRDQTLSDVLSNATGASPDIQMGAPMDAPAFSLHTALREAYLFNPDLRAARARTKAVFEQLPQATAFFQPTITASGNATYASSDTDTNIETSGTEKTAGIDLSQPLYRGGRTVAGIRAADSRIDAQLAQLADLERSVLFRAAQAYMDVIKNQATVTVNTQNRDVIARQLQATKDRFRAGDITRTDVAQSEFRLSRAEADVIASIGAYRSSRAVFEQIVGIDPPDDLELPTSLFPLPNQLDIAIAAAETYHPAVITAKAEHRAAENNIDIETGSLLPDVALNAGISGTRGAVSSAYDDSDTGRVGVSVSMPLYEGGATRSRVRAAKYTANELYLKILSARRAAREETIRAFENLAAARAEYTAREAQVHAATIARDGVHQEANLGERTILDALDADLELRDAQIAEITARRNQVVAEFALASAIGQLVPGNVGIEEQIFDPSRIRDQTVYSLFSTSVDKEPEDGR